MRMPTRSLIVLLLTMMANLVWAAALVPQAPKLAANAYLLMDADSGHIIVEHNADEQVPPASLTKMMTAYILAYEV
ncbi:MAG: serine-type D-Ala-D-Ala carboxypeptidase, partial [Pseudomonadales bacterium]